MKRFYLLLALGVAILMLVNVGDASKAGKFTTVTVQDSIDPTSHTGIVGDTSIDSMRVDTGYSHATRIDDYTHITFYARATFDTNWTDDTLFGILEVTADKDGTGNLLHWVVVDTIFRFLNTDSAYGERYVRLDTLTYIPDLARIQVVYRDSNEITMPAWADNTYDHTCDIWLKGW